MPIDPGTAMVISSALGGLFGGGEQTNPASEQQARLLRMITAWMRQNMPQIISAYRGMATRPEQDPGYLLSRQTLLREQQGMLQRDIDPYLMDLARRNMWDSSMMGQVLSNRSGRLAAANSAQIAQALANTRAQGLQGWQNAVLGGANTGAGVSSAWTPLSNMYEQNQQDFMRSLQMAAQAYGQSQIVKQLTRDTTSQNNPSVVIQPYGYSSWGQPVFPAPRMPYYPRGPLET